MNGYSFTLAGAALTALPSGALWWAERRLLAFSDLHLGKADRLARRGGQMLPPYETRDTLARMQADIAATDPATIVCLGDSFDDPEGAATLGEAERMSLAGLQAGRLWIWVEGNHDPGPPDLSGTHLAEFDAAPLTFRHIADPGAQREVSGHFHPKAVLTLRGQRVSRPCFLFDSARVILPAYGTYTGGLRLSSPALRRLMGPDACAVLTGRRAHALPMAAA